jgi:hypothetical protein
MLVRRARKLRTLSNAKLEVSPSLGTFESACAHKTAWPRSMQDVVKRARTPLALSALLRIRTSKELRVVAAYGKLTPDADHDGIWHIVAADPHDTFTVSLELATAHGLLARSGARAPQPAIQVRLRLCGSSLPARSSNATAHFVSALTTGTLRPKQCRTLSGKLPMRDITLTLSTNFAR